MHRFASTVFTCSLFLPLLACNDEPSNDDEADADTETGEPLSCLDTDPAGEDIIINSDDDIATLALAGCVPGKLLISGGGVTNISGLSTLTEVGTLEIRYNPMLTSLAGIEQLERIGRLIIVGNSMLTTLPEFGALTRVDGITVTGNAALTSLGSFPNITTIERLELGDNAALAQIDGLSTLTSLTGDLQLTSNQLFVDFSPLAGVTSVGGNLTIEDNPVLADLGLIGLTSVGEDLRIISNLELSECIVADFVAELEVGGAIVTNDNKVDLCD